MRRTCLSLCFIALPDQRRLALISGIRSYHQKKLDGHKSLLSVYSLHGRYSAASKKTGDTSTIWHATDFQIHFSPRKQPAKPLKRTDDVQSICLHHKGGISRALLYLALRGVDVGTLTGRLSQIDPRWIICGIMALLVQIVLQSLRWRHITSQSGANMGRMQMFRFAMIGLFFNQTLPSSIGGDAVRIWLVGGTANWQIAAYTRARSLPSGGIRYHRRRGSLCVPPINTIFNLCKTLE